MEDEYTVYMESTIDMSECRTLEAAAYAVWSWFMERQPEMLDDEERDRVCNNLLDGYRNVNPEIDTLMESEAEAMIAAGKQRAIAERQEADATPYKPAQWLQDAMDQADNVMDAPASDAE